MKVAPKRPPHRPVVPPSNVSDQRNTAHNPSRGGQISGHNSRYNPATQNNTEKQVVRDYARNTGEIKAPTEGTIKAAEAQTADQIRNSQRTGAVDFSKMSQDQQYDYLHSLTVQRAGGDPKAWNTGNREANIVGIRSFQNGKAASPEADKYNDTIYVARMVNGKKEVHAFDASVDGGVFRNQELKNKKSYKASEGTEGITHMADGFHRDAFKLGSVNGREMGLRQAGWVGVNIDKNGDGKIQNDEKLTDGKRLRAGTGWQMQFHRGGEGGRVGETSSGCQVIRDSQYERFQRLLDDTPLSQKRFSYCLTDSSKLSNNLPPPPSIETHRTMFNSREEERHYSYDSEAQGAGVETAGGRSAWNRHYGGDADRDIIEGPGQGIITTPGPSKFTSTRLETKLSKTRWRRNIW